MYPIVTVPLVTPIILHLNNEETGAENVTHPQVGNGDWFKCGQVIADSGLLANIKVKATGTA